MTGNMDMAGGRSGNRWTPVIWSVAAALIALPFVAMQFTQEVDWTAGDFMVAAIMIGGSCVVIEITMRMTRNWAYRGGALLALAGVFLLFWINGAVGIIGNEGNLLNLIYASVIMTVIGGAIGAKFQAAGMARATITAAVVMAVIGMFVVTSGRTDPPGAFGYVVLHGIFVALFAASALLFRKAARGQVA